MANVIYLSEHITSLGAQHGIVVQEKQGTSGRAFERTRMIRITPVKGVVSYAIALHELGHLIADGASGRKHKRLDKEMRAWQWARANGLVWTDRMDDTMQKCLQSYLRRALRHHWPIPPRIYQMIEGVW